MGVDVRTEERRAHRPNESEKKITERTDSEQLSVLDDQKLRQKLEHIFLCACQINGE